MAGTIKFGSAVCWSAASWLFDWVLRTIAQRADDIELSAELFGIVDENLGWLALDELPANQRDQFEKVVVRELMTASAALPADLDCRELVLSHLRSLVHMLDSSTE